jgi:hypothetical protein
MVVVEKKILNQYGTHVLCHLIDQKGARTWEVLDLSIVTLPVEIQKII